MGLKQWMSRRQAPATSKPSHDHSCRWGATTAYFIFTQSTRGEINLGKAVERLLVSEIATSAAWPSEEVVRVSPSLEALDRDVAQLRSMHENLTNLRGLGHLLRTLLRHPHALGIVWPTIAAAVRSRPKQTDADGHDGDSQSMDELLKEIELVLLQSQKVVIAEREIDDALFGGFERSDDAFVRLHLRSTHQTILINDAQHEVTLEPRVLLHRDGQIQVTVGLPLPVDLFTNDVVAAAYPGAALATAAEIPEPYGVSAKWVPGEWTRERDAGERLRRFDHAKAPASIDSAWVLFLSVSLASGR